MANAFPMVERCFEQQWRGLGNGNQEWAEMITEISSGPGYHSFYPAEVIVAMDCVPLWTTDTLCLMSVKVD